MLCTTTAAVNAVILSTVRLFKDAKLAKRLSGEPAPSAAGEISILAAHVTPHGAMGEACEAKIKFHAEPD